MYAAISKEKSSYFRFLQFQQTKKYFRGWLTIVLLKYFKIVLTKLEIKIKCNIYCENCLKNLMIKLLYLSAFNYGEFRFEDKKPPKL